MKAGRNIKREPPLVHSTEKGRMLLQIPPSCNNYGRCLRALAGAIDTDHILSVPILGGERKTKYTRMERSDRMQYSTRGSLRHLTSLLHKM